MEVPEWGGWGGGIYIPVEQGRAVAGMDKDHRQSTLRPARLYPHPDGGEERVSSVS